MRVSRLTVAASLAILSPTLAQPAAPAQPAPPGPALRPPQLAGKENAALLYYRAWDLLSREDATTVGETFENNAAYQLTPDQIKVLENNQKYVGLVLKAAGTPTCDWGIQYDQGWEALLPHLSKMRQTCRFLGADARRCLDAGRPADAAERIGAIALMADQTRNDGILISALVGAAIASYGCAATDVAFELRALTPDSARTILNALREVDQENAFGGRSAIMFEGWSVVDWPRTKFTGPTAGHDLRVLLDSTTNDLRENTESPLDKMDAARLSVELDQARPYFEEVVKLWDEPDAPAKLDALNERVAKGEFGETAKVLVPSFGKARSGIQKSVNAINATIKDLETFISTGKTPADLAADLAAEAPEAAK